MFKIFISLLLIQISYASVDEVTNNEINNTWLDSLFNKNQNTDLKQVIKEKIYLAQKPQSVHHYKNQSIIQYLDGTIVLVSYEPKIKFQNLFRFPNRKVINWANNHILVSDSASSQIEWVDIRDGNILFQKDLTQPLLSTQNSPNGNLYIDEGRFITSLGRQGINWSVEKALYPGCDWNLNKGHLLLKNCIDGNIRQLDLELGTVKTLFSWPERINQILPFGAGYFIYANNILFFLNHYGNEVWQLRVKTNSQFSLHNNELFYKNFQRYYSLHQKSSKLAWSQSDLEMLGSDNSFLFYSPTGYLRLLDKNLSNLFDYHTGNPIIGEPYFNNSKVIIYDSLPSITVIEKAKISLMNIQKTAVESLKPCLKKNTLDKRCLLEMDSLGVLEPGQVIIRLLDIKESLSNKQNANIDSLFERLIDENKYRKFDLNASLKKLSAHYQLKWIDASHNNQHQFVKLFSGQDQFLSLYNSSSNSIKKLSTKNSKVLSSQTVLLDADFIGIHNQKFWFTKNKKLIEVSSYKNTHKSRSWNLKFKLNSIHFVKNSIWLIGEDGHIATLKDNHWKLVAKRPNSKPIKQSVLESGIFRQYNSKLFEWKPFIGSQKGIRPFKNSSSTHYALGNIIYLYADKKLKRFDPQPNKMRWISRLDASIFSLQNLSKNKIILGLANQEIVALDKKKGTKLWSFKGKNSLLIRPLVDDQVVWIDQGSTLIGLDKKTGKVLVNKKLPISIGSFTKNDKQLFISSPKGIVLAIDKSTLF
jgi:outer membrane protein assembly factor BamB